MNKDPTFFNTCIVQHVVMKGSELRLQGHVKYKPSSYFRRFIKLVFTLLWKFRFIRSHWMTVMRVAVMSFYSSILLELLVRVEVTRRRRGGRKGDSDVALQSRVVQDL